jgi:hypothetical protein
MQNIKIYCECGSFKILTNKESSKHKKIYSFECECKKLYRIELIEQIKK